MNYIEWLDKVWLGLCELWAQLSEQEREKGINASSLEEHICPGLAATGEAAAVRRATLLALNDLGLRGIGTIKPRQSQNVAIYFFPDEQQHEKQVQSRTLLKRLDGREKWLLRAVASRAERQHSMYAIVEICNVKVIYQLLWGKWDADAAERVEKALNNLSRAQLVVLDSSDSSIAPGDDERTKETFRCRPTYSGMTLVQELSKKK